MLFSFNNLTICSKSSFSFVDKKGSILGALITKSFLPSTLSSRILKGLVWILEIESIVN